MSLSHRLQVAEDEEMAAAGVVFVVGLVCAVAFIPSVALGTVLGGLGGLALGPTIAPTRLRRHLLVASGVVVLALAAWAALGGPLAGAVSAWWGDWTPVFPLPHFGAVAEHLPVLLALGLAGVPLGLGLGARARGRTSSPAEVSRSERREVDRPVGIGALEGGGRYGLAAEQLRQHILCVGASGAGKTTLIGHVLSGVHGQGVGAVVVDLKGDPSLEAVARRVDRGAEVFRIDGTEGWDPLVSGDPTSVRDMVMGLETFTEPHYRRAGERFMALIANAMVMGGETLTLTSLAAALEQPQAAAQRYQGLLAREGADERTQQLSQRLGHVGDLLATERSLVSGIVGLGNRLGVLVDSPSIGPRLAPRPEQDTAAGFVSLDHALLDGGIVLFSLDAAVYASEAPALGALVLAATHARASQLGRQDGLRCLLVIDEAAQLPDAGRALPRLIQMGRSVGQGTLIGTQSITDLERLEALEEVWESCATKLVMRQDVPSSAQWVADSVGTKTSRKITRKFEQDLFLRHATGDESEREVEEYVVHPNTIRTLRTGQAVAVERWPRSAAWRIQVDPFEGL